MRLEDDQAESLPISWPDGQGGHVGQEGQGDPGQEGDRLSLPGHEEGGVGAVLPCQLLNIFIIVMIPSKL